MWVTVLLWGERIWNRCRFWVPEPYFRFWLPDCMYTHCRITTMRSGHDVSEYQFGTSGLQLMFCTCLWWKIQKIMVSHHFHPKTSWCGAIPPPRRMSLFACLQDCLILLEPRPSRQTWALSEVPAPPTPSVLLVYHLIPLSTCLSLSLYAHFGYFVI